MPLTLEQGRRIVTIARARLDSFVGGGDTNGQAEPEDKFLEEKKGVFVTLSTKGNGAASLRGCIGFPYPVQSLGDALVQATVAAASEDPRFPPVAPQELAGLVVEVSVLTQPEEVVTAKRVDLPSQIHIGRDGLMISNGHASGLLLPQVAAELSLSPSDFLSEACMKAGLLPDSWLEGQVTVKRFQAEVFGEERPHGPVRRLFE